MALGLGPVGRGILKVLGKQRWLDRTVDSISSPACRLLGGTPRLTRDMFDLYQKVQRARNVDPRAVREIEIRSDGFYALGPGNELMKMGANPLGEHFPSPIVLRLEIDSSEKLTKYMRGLIRMLRQYKKKGGDLEFYAHNILPLLIQNAKTPKELEIWEKEIRGLLAVSMKVFGGINLILPKISQKIESIEEIKEVRQVIVDFCKETGVVGGDFERIFMGAVGKIGPLSELRDWLELLQDMVKDFKPEFGDRSYYLKNGLREVLQNANSLVKMEEARLLISDYAQKYGNPRDYIKQAVVPILITVEGANKLIEARLLIGDYIKKGFSNPAGYAKDVVLPLAEKLSEEKLKAVSEFLVDYNKAIGDPRDIIEYAVCRILDKAETPAELRLWGKEIKNLVLDFTIRFGNPQKYLRTALSKLMKKVRSIEELRAARHFIAEVGEEFEDPEPYIGCIEYALLLVMDKVLLPPEMKEWGVEIKKFIIDTKAWFDDHRDCVENALPAIIVAAKFPAFIKVTKYQMRAFSVQHGYQRGYITEIIPRIISKANEVGDITEWDREAVRILNILGPEFGYGPLARILDQSPAFPQFKAWRGQIDKFWMDYQAVMQMAPGKDYVKEILFRALAKSGSLENFIEWRQEIKAFLSDYQRDRKISDKRSVPAQLTEYLDGSPTVAHFIAARSFPFL